MADACDVKFAAETLGRFPHAFRIFRAAQQMALALRAGLTPDQWAGLIQALAAFAAALASIFGGQKATGPESESPPDKAGGDQKEPGCS